MTNYYEEDVVLTSDHFSHRLICPICNGDNLHQRAVGVYRHTHNDNQGVLIAPDGECTVHTKLHADILNPSGAREGIRISFWCEHSCKTPDLLILQHKGTTYMGWENEPSGSRLWPNET